MQLDAIMLDQWVPGDDACELIAELKSRRPALPILMLTTSTSPLLAVEAMRAGATDYLVKPVAPDRLMQALRSATTARSAARRARAADREDAGGARFRRDGRHRAAVPRRAGDGRQGRARPRRRC